MKPHFVTNVGLILLKPRHESATLGKRFEAETKGTPAFQIYARMK